MTTDERKRLEDRLKSQTYEVVGRELRPVESQDLLTLIDSTSIKVGDTAAEYLGGRHETELLIDALLRDRIRTARGRVRATNTLTAFGRDLPAAVDAYVHLLSDRSADVVDTALFGIVFWRRRDLIPKLREHLAAAKGDAKRERFFREAITALEADDPSLFSPDFYDANNVWRLNEPAP